MKRLKIFVRFLSLLLALAPTEFFLSILFMGLSAAAEGMGLLMLLPFLKLAGMPLVPEIGAGALSLRSPEGEGGLSAVVSAAFRWAGIEPSLLWVLVLFGFFMIGRSAFLRWEAFFVFRLEQTFLHCLRKRVHEAILKRDWLSYAAKPSGDYLYALTGQMERTGDAVQLLLTLAASAAVSMIYVLLALGVSASATGLVLVSGGLVSFFLRKKVLKAHRLGETVSESSGALYRTAEDDLQGMKITKAHAFEEKSRRAFSGRSKEAYSAHLAAFRGIVSARMWHEWASVLILVCLVWVSFRLFGVGTAEFLFLFFLFSRLMPRFSLIQQNAQEFLGILPFFEGLDELQKGAFLAKSARTASRSPFVFEKEITLDNVSFSYSGQTVPALTAVNLVIPKGELVVVVGPSGAGKTTLLDILAGLIWPTEGSFLVDGRVVLSGELPLWKARIGYLAQDAFLFHESLRSNFLRFSPDTSEVAMREALRWAACEELLDRLPEGLDTPVGNRGQKLSLGERQRVALACIFLRQPDVLLLDEPTSHLDPPIEKRIADSLKTLKGRMTLIVATHSPQIAEIADRVFSLTGIPIAY